MKNNHVKRSIFSNNQDLLRGTVQSLEIGKIVTALKWLNGYSEYPFPTSIHLNLTLRCNCRCLHCKQWSWPAHSELSPENIERIFEVFSSWGVTSVTFGGGNPLLYKHFYLALQLAEKYKIEVGIISEGGEISQDTVELINQYAKWIRFSIDAPIPDVHNKIRNSPGLFERVIHNIKQFREKGNKLSIGINCVVQKQNLKLLSQMVGFAKDQGVDILLFKMPHGEDTNKKYLLSSEEYSQFIDWINDSAQLIASGKGLQTNLTELNYLIHNVFNNNDVVNGKPVHDFYIQNDVRCFAPLFFLTCNSEGFMYPCDYLQADTRTWGGHYRKIRKEFCLGNVLEHPDNTIENLKKIVKHRIFTLPSNGFDEWAHLLVGGGVDLGVDRTSRSSYPEVRS